MPSCPKCGTFTPPPTEFCSKCGLRIYVSYNDLEKRLEGKLPNFLSQLGFKNQFKGDGILYSVEVSPNKVDKGSSTYLMFFVQSYYDGLSELHIHLRRAECCDLPIKKYETKFAPLEVAQIGIPMNTLNYKGLCFSGKKEVTFEIFDKGLERSKPIIDPKGEHASNYAKNALTIVAVGIVGAAFLDIGSNKCKYEITENSLPERKTVDKVFYKTLFPAPNPNSNPSQI